MRRKTVVSTGLSALLLVGTWATAGLAPASATTPDPASTSIPTSMSAPAPEAARAASEGLLTAMRQEFGLTKTQAVARLAAEEAAAAIEDKAQRVAGSSYGGSWFSATDSELTVALTDASKATAVRATGATVKLVKHSERALDATMKRIDALSAPAGVSGWHVDPKTNRVVVSVVASERSDKAVAGFVAKAKKAGPVTVAETTQAPTTFAAGTVGGDPYYTGNVRCSIGFSVHGGFVTAGHCGPRGQAVRGWDNSAIGSFQGSSFPGNDYAWVNVANGWWTVPVVLGWGAVSDQLVRGSNEAPIGASICRSGSTTHWRCGNVLGKNETVNYAQGAVHQMTKTSVCAEGGDSGGSFLSGDQAQGVTSGGWGNCGGGGETWYQPINEILSTYGLTLHTA